MFLQLYKSKIQYFRKNYSGFSVVLYKFILFFASLLRFLFAPIGLIAYPSRREEYTSLVRNYSDLILALPKM